MSQTKYFLDPAGNNSVKFFSKHLRHSKGEWAGRPLSLEQWQADILRTLFGWKYSCPQCQWVGGEWSGCVQRFHPRKYRTCYIEIPRKNGKSTLSAGIALYLLFADGESGAEVYSAAADRDQAAIVFEAARSMVDANKTLKGKCQTYRRSVVVPASGSAYRVLSADAPTKHGLNAHGIIFDELHAQPNRELWDVLTTSTGARQQPLVIAITTAGYDKHSICYEIHDYACKVRDGIVKDDSFLPVIYGAEKDDDWKEPKTWAKANPNIGVSIKTDYLEAECKRAQEVPAYENTFKRLHLNVWTEQAERAIPMDKWDACSELKLEIDHGEPGFAGLDMASKVDVAAFVLVFPKSETKPWRVKPYFWIPEDTIRERSKRDRVPYDAWLSDGVVEMTPGNVIDFDVIRRRINEIRAEYNIQEIAKDPWNTTQLGTQLLDDGFTVTDVPQTIAHFTDATKELLAAVVAKNVAHGGNKVLRWMASNLAVRQDASGNLRPDKDKSAEKIDGIVAALMGMARAMAAPQYATPEIFAL